ncbi:MAG: hypothetical protein ACRECV_02450 [Xanthobacteraceae bacterium]
MAGNDTQSVLQHGELEFDFEKSNYFRVIHVDGFFGGVAPASQLLHMAVYNERQPIPKKVFHPVLNGVLQPETIQKRETRSGLFREVEADLVLSMEGAMALRSWLDEKITEMQNTRAQILAMMQKG